MEETEEQKIKRIKKEEHLKLLKKLESEILDELFEEWEDSLKTTLDAKVKLSVFIHGEQNTVYSNKYGPAEVTGLGNGDVKRNLRNALFRYWINSFNKK
jgi:hypothetical protein